MSIMNMPLPTAGTANPIEPQPPVKKRAKLEISEGSRLSALMAQLPEMEAAAKDAAERLKEHKKAVQAEIAKTVEDPEQLPDVFDIPADPYGAHPAYTLAAREGSWSLDAEAMKTQEPHTYVKWAKRGKPYWELKRVQRNRVK